MPKGYHHLTRDQRCQLITLKKRGESVANIAVELKVHRSNIYKEIKRNSGLCGYRYKQADKKALERKSIAIRARKRRSQALMQHVEAQLCEGWSPEQISGRLKIECSSETLSHETIYQHIWNNKRAGGTLFKYLRHNGKKYNKRRSGKAGRGCIPNRVDISERPKLVEEKSRLGDWEIDTIVGSGNSGCVVSMVDRMTKLVMLVKTPNRTASQVTKALLGRLYPFKDYILTITADNGKEFSQHEIVSTFLDTKYYFATPYHSWERGLNEHTNGLVRQYLPKKMKFHEVTDEELMKVEYKLNNRPRKVLNFETPSEVFIRNSAQLDLSHL